MALTPTARTPEEARLLEIVSAVIKHGFGRIEIVVSARKIVTVHHSYTEKLN